MNFRNITSFLTLLFIVIAPLTAQDATECAEDFRLFDHALLATDPVCIPEDPQRIAFIDSSIAYGIALGVESITRNYYFDAFLMDRLEAYKQLSPTDISIMNMFFSNDAGYYRDGQSGTCNLLKEVAICDWPDPNNAATGSVEANGETLLQLNPDVILISAYGFEGMTAEEIQAKLSERHLWAELSAIQSGRVFVEPEGLNLDGMGRVGMNLMLDYFMPLLYPDVFAAPLTDQQVAEILADDGGETFSITDATGTTLTFDARPERVI